MHNNYKVRFHLGKGKHFMHWRVECLHTGDVQFYDPNIYELKMYGCKLYNQVGGATKIFNRETDKSVVAWVQCEAVGVYCKNSWNSLASRVHYNPHVNPHWIHDGKVVDKTLHDKLFTTSNKIFKPMVSA